MAPVFFNSVMPHVQTTKPMMIRNLNVYLALFVSLLILGCAPAPRGSSYVSPRDADSAELVAEKGSVWGAFTRKVATTAIKEVDGLPFEGYHHPIKIDDKIMLPPGVHSIGVRLWGNPRDIREGFESYPCLRFTALPNAHYVLRGSFFDPENFRLELISIEGGNEQLISELKVPLDIKRVVPICRPDEQKLNGAI